MARWRRHAKRAFPGWLLDPHADQDAVSAWLDRCAADDPDLFDEVFPLVLSAPVYSQLLLEG